MSNNRLIIAAAGSGKTTFLVEEALRQEGSVLLLTYTQSNEASIKAKFLQLANCIPKNVTVQTWFSFLLQHGVKPYQGSLDESLFEQDVRGMVLVNKQSGVRFQGNRGPVYWSEGEYFDKHYFTSKRKIYSDKISKFAVKCNKAASNAVIDRIARIYDAVFIDEVQDLAGHDLELINELFKSTASILLTGDPRQVTYLTHVERKFSKYKNGRIKDFVESADCRIPCEVDESTLSTSHRNNLALCDYSSRLYPCLPRSVPCSCCHQNANEHEGVFLLRPGDVEAYIHKRDLIQLRWNSRKSVSPNIPVMNFGESKGHTYGRVLIYPTDDMTAWIADNNKTLSDGATAKFYVAITRARHSATIVMDYDQNQEYDGVTKYIPEGEK